MGPEAGATAEGPGISTFRSAKPPIIKDICTSKVVSVGSDLGAIDAIHKMCDSKISCLVVADNGTPIGILTERDVVRHARSGTEFANKTIRDIMTTPVVSIRPEADIYSAYHLITSNSIRHLVVVDQQGGLYGIVTQSDIINNLGLDLFEARQVAKIMTKNIVRILPTDPAIKVVEALADRAISCVVITTEKTLVPVGIATERDVATLVSRGVDISRVKVEEHFLKKMITLDVNAPIFEVVRLMKQRGVRRIVVVEQSGRLAGVVTQSDIVRGVLEGRYVEALQEIIRRKDRILQHTEKTLIEKTIFLDSILYSARDLAVVATDEQMKVVYFNHTAEKIFGRPEDEVIGRGIVELHLALGAKSENMEYAVDQLHRHEEYSDIVKVSDKDGGIVVGFRISAIKDMRDHNHRFRGFIMLARDIAGRMRKEDQLSQVVERYRTLFEHARDMVYMTALDGKILEVNEAGAHLLGYDNNELVGMNITSIYSEPSLRDEFVRKITSEKYVKDFEFDAIRKTGELIHLSVTATVQRDYAGSIVGYQGIIRDVTDRKKQEARITHMAFHDALTGLPNRRVFDDRLTMALEHAKRNKISGAILFLDLDNFKAVNDQFGHDIGDELLREVAGAIKSCLRAEDTVSRMGGDEFVVLLPEIKRREDAELAAKKVIEALAASVTLSGEKMETSASIGIGLFPEQNDTAETVLKRADDAMYVVKRAGRNGFHTFVPEDAI